MTSRRSRQSTSTLISAAGRPRPAFLTATCIDLMPWTKDAAFVCQGCHNLIDRHKIGKEVAFEADYYQTLVAKNNERTSRMKCEQLHTVVIPSSTCKKTKSTGPLKPVDLLAGRQRNFPKVSRQSSSLLPSLPLRLLLLHLHSFRHLRSRMIPQAIRAYMVKSTQSRQHLLDKSSSRLLHCSPPSVAAMNQLQQVFGMSTRSCR